MDNLCIITARGGSKRIPKKNIKAFCGKPIISYSIEAALESGLFDEVMVSTDDVEIAEISMKYGAKVPFMRSARNSDDYATTADVLNEVLEEYSNIGKLFKNMCCIYPTAPFVTAQKLCIAYDKFINSNADALIPIVKFSYPPQRCFIKHNDVITYKWPEYIKARSQDLEPYYHDAGQFYFYNVNSFIIARKKNDVKSYMMKNTYYELDELEVQDIDNLLDWKLAEIKYKLLNGEIR
ncbi:MAG: pseudaminic acid cytidylyltransferase [Selenomonadaceae bacterium]|nr:pseudaminic acid cytidylyltransferase [Selenomonadaceae bacterium]